MKRGLHTILHRPQLLWMCAAMENMEKKSSLNSSKTRLHWWKHLAAKCSRIWWITLYTLFAFRTDFICSFLFRHCSRIVCGPIVFREMVFLVKLGSSCSARRAAFRTDFICSFLFGHGSRIVCGPIVFCEMVLFVKLGSSCFARRAVSMTNSKGFFAQTEEVCRWLHTIRK